MAKVTISRLFEISRYLTTTSGKELQGALQYLSEFAEVTLRILRNGITFPDNVDCALKTVLVHSGVLVTVSAPTGKRVVDIHLRKVNSSQYYIVDKFGWFYNSTGLITIYLTLVDSSGGSPPSSSFANVDLLLLFS